MTRSRAPGTSRSVRGNASLEGSSRIEVSRRGGRSSPSLPSTRMRRGRGLPLVSKKKEPTKEEEDESPPVEQDDHDDTGESHSTSIIEDSKDPTPDLENHNETEPDEDNEDEKEEASRDEDNETQDMDENDDEEESSIPRVDSNESRTLQAFMQDKTVTVSVTVNNEIVADPELDVSSRLRARRGVMERASSSSENHGTRSSRNGTTPGTPARTVVGHDGNLFYCHFCKDVGDVVCCDGCPRVYHPTCIPLDDPSRQSLDNDDDPWYCPDCINKKLKGTSSTSRRLRTGNRMVKRKCSECQESGGDFPMEPCDGCGVYLHHPSCTGQDMNGDVTGFATPMCSNCRAEAVVADEDAEKLISQRKKRKLRHDDDDDMSNTGDEDDETSAEGADDEAMIRRKRSRSVDTMSTDGDDISEMDDDHEDGAEGHGDDEEEGGSSDDSFKPGRKAKRSNLSSKKSKKKGRPALKHKLFGSAMPTSDGPPVKKKRGRPRLTPEEKQERAEQRKHKHKCKKKKRRHFKESKEHEIGSPARGGSPTNGEVPLSPPRRAHHGLVKATPAFFFFLSDNRLKIERVLARKKPLFNRLPKGLERTELVAKEGALWWVKARPGEQQRYLAMSMRDFEEQVIAWKEEKSIKEMMISRESDNEIDGEQEGEMGAIEDDGTIDGSPEDEMITYNNHQRLYVATSVGSKPYVPEPGKSNNRVLLELLQDMRFHPLPMFNPHRSDSEVGQTDYSKMTIPYFDVHGPVSSSVGDECLGCTRGWNHFCPVLQRRFPAVEHRARLQPPLSSLMATRVGLGLQKNVVDADQETLNPFASRDAELFSVRETQEAALAKSLPEVSSFFLSQPSTRADDVVQFVEEAVAMKIPEPPRPSAPTIRPEQPKKALARGALPTRGRKKNLDPAEAGFSAEMSDDGTTGTVKKCGRCRTIIQSDTGCIQCRRAQLVINMSKRQPTTAHTKLSKRDGGAAPGGSGFLKVQTTMLGRVTLKESNFDKQSEGDRAISNAMTSMRWSPNAVMPPQKILVPTPKPKRIRHDLEAADRPDDGDVLSDEFSDGSEGSTDNNEEDAEKKPAASMGEQQVLPTSSGSNSSSTDEDEKPLSRMIPTRASRKRASARLVGTGSNSGGSDRYQEADRQKMAEAHKEEAQELHNRCLSVACSGILLAMMRRDPLWLFAEPVPPNVVGYSKIVKDPIDFGKIRSKVLDGAYSSFGAFISDARRLCTNALAFNPPGSIYSKTAKELYDVLEVMQKRASNWIGAIRDAHASSFSWRRPPEHPEFDDMSGEPSDAPPTKHDSFKELRKTWPEAVEYLENGDWARLQIDADFMRTRENEFAYYGSLAVRRAAAAAEASLAQYPDKGGTHNVVVKRSHIEDEALRRYVDDQVANLVNPAQLKEIPGWREEAIIRILRRVQSRRVEGRIASENGCARCDGIRIEPEAKMAMTAESVRWGRNKKKGELDTLPRMHETRLALSTGLASAKARELVEKEKKDRDRMEAGKFGKVNDVSVSVRGSRIHGWGLFADQPFQKGEVVAEYIGEYISNPVADAREKMYQEQRIQDYQFRLDEHLVIDATMRGGHGRYINHNCNPNCVAKIIDGEPPNKHLKRVLIISQRDIKAREEITYDYQFPLELDLEERIPCNCGSMLCRGFMNWDLPEKGSKNRVMRTQKRGGNMRDRIRRLGRPLKKVEVEAEVEVESEL